MTPADDLRTSHWLLSRLRNLRDDSAWRTFWGRYQPRIRSWALVRGLSAADADDVDLHGRPLGGDRGIDIGHRQAAADMVAVAA